MTCLCRHPAAAHVGCTGGCYVPGCPCGGVAIDRDREAHAKVQADYEETFQRYMRVGLALLLVNAGLLGLCAAALWVGVLR